MAAEFVPSLREDAVNLGICTLLAIAGFGVACYQPPADAAGSTPTESVLYSFCTQSNCTDGANSSAGLIADANGNLFGTTRSGGNGANCPGTTGCGTVFEIAKSASGYASTPTILYSFCGAPDCSDGAEPFAGLIADASGNLFGTTAAGGVGWGTVFEIAKTASGYASTPTILYSFSGEFAVGGSVPSGLIADASGNLFGTTTEGGANEEGAVFEIAKTASGYASIPTILYSFCSQSNCTDGAFPQAGVIVDASGNLLGTRSAARIELAKALLVPRSTCCSYM
jgi:uncharacterized repeat protein (TIGR03803 family)